MEQTQNHFLQDIFRLKEGVILEINKYKRIGHYSEYSLSRNGQKVKKQKLKGISKSYQLHEAVTLFGGKVVPEGAYVIGETIVEPVTDPKDFTVELKSSGGSIYGDIDQHCRLHRDIEAIFSSYN